MGQFYVKLGADITQFQSKMQQATKSLEQAGKKMQNIGKSMSLYVTAPLTAIGGLAVKAYADIEGVRIAFERLNQPGLLDNLRQATSGTVSDLELMKAAVKAQNFAIPLDQLGTLLEFAGRRAKDTGENVDYLVESIVTGIGRKSPLILDNLGISASELKDRLGGVAVASASIGDITQVVGSIAREQLQQMGQDTLTLSDQIGQVNASFQNTLGEFGEILSRALKPLIENLILAMKYFQQMPMHIKETVVLLSTAFAMGGPILVGLGFLTSSVLPAMVAGFSALLSPITLLVAGLMAFVAANEWLDANMFKITYEMGLAVTKLQNKFVDLGITIVEALKPALEFLGYDTNGILGRLKAMKVDILPGVKTEWKDFGDVFSEKLEGIKTKILGTSAAISSPNATSLNSSISAIKSNVMGIDTSAKATTIKGSENSERLNAGDPYKIIPISLERNLDFADELFEDINGGLTETKLHTQKAAGQMDIFSDLMGDLSNQLRGVLGQFMGGGASGGDGGFWRTALGVIGNSLFPGVGGIIGQGLGAGLGSTINNDPTNPYYGITNPLTTKRSPVNVNVQGRIDGDSIVFLYDEKKDQQDRYFG